MKTWDRDVEQYVYTKTGVDMPWSEIDQWLRNACEKAGVPREGLTIASPVFQNMLARLALDSLQSVGGVPVAI